MRGKGVFDKTTFSPAPPLPCSPVPPSNFQLLASNFFLLALLLFVSGCRPPAPPPAAELLVQFTCDTRGRLVPCGCFSGQYGGLTRLMTVLRELPGAGASGVRVDVGDAIGGVEDYHVMEYRRILQAYALMDYDAVNLGHREARLPLSVLRNLKATSPVPLISANLLDKTTGKPFLDPYRLVQHNGLKVAVVGVLDPRGGLGEQLGAGLAVERMESALARVLPEVRARADVVILLAFTDEDTLAALARDFYEADIILGGKVRQPAQKLEKANRSLVYFTTNEARTLGLLRARFEGRGRLTPLENDILFLKDTIPEDAQIIALAKAYRQEARQARLDVDSPERLQENLVPGVKSVSAYVGSEACLECHPTSAATWQKSAHSHAFRTLVNVGADADPKCIECHTVGFGTATGYRRMFGSVKLVDVGCESCHGPGSLHVRQHKGDKTVAFKFRPLGAGDCQKCHYGEFSRPFDWDQFWPAVAHGKEPPKPKPVL